WMVLAGVFSKEDNSRLLRRLKMVDPRIRLISPYAQHYYVDALCHNGMEDEITDYIRGYWGKMVEAGADCYWEVFDPLDPDASPYGSKAILSYCHAWSCTASYFIRKWL
ncbi:MAG: sugar hydrolase, partial [Lachnospiraceae bacterium]|nr:sugar hydrolase [Lachnospiraceae bacterium]